MMVPSVLFLDDILSSLLEGINEDSPTAELSGPPIPPPLAVSLSPERHISSYIQTPHLNLQPYSPPVTVHDWTTVPD
ncbi:hypothetical protein FRB95_006085 [Tulasnella sp. JGI-2019a]|nr:hypothetical protein FRB95_006085 [Tulasnella sp. JGI-2019a]